MYHTRYIAKLQQKTSIVNRDLAVLGCSFGHECRALVDGGARSVVGFDLDARIGRDFSDPRVQYRRESVTDIQLPEASVDIVYSAAVFEHVHDLPRAFAEAARICRPGGTIFIISSPLWYAPYGNHMASILERLPWCHLLYKPSELKQRIHDEYPELPAERVHELLEIIFDPSYFNRLPASVYLATCAGLDSIAEVSNTLWPAAVNQPPGDRYLQACLEHGYAHADLLSGGHYFCATKC
jgi:SAM-dependent methyltransferase